jgi:ABC-type multidrug transport system ATPase subunit
LEAAARAQFYTHVMETGVDKILITGDIAEAKDACELLAEFSKHTNKFIYFVLGNHDYYFGSVKNSLSGGQRFNEKLTEALAAFPNILLLDEPTNHLDRKNRNSLMRMLRSFEGTLVIVTHDIELLRHAIDTIWHIDQGRVHVFTGSYDDYRHELALQHRAIEQELSLLSLTLPLRHPLLWAWSVRGVPKCGIR